MILCALLVAAPSLAAEGAAVHIEDLAWLSGDWRGEDPSEDFEERYTTAAGGTILGTSRIVQDGKAVHVEFLLIEEKPEGIFLTVILPGRKNILFQLKQADASTLVFEADNEGMPERLTYLRTADNRLTIRLEKQGRAIDFKLKKAGASLILE